MGWSVYLADITEGQYANPFTPTEILIVLFYSFNLNQSAVILWKYLQTDKGNNKTLINPIRQLLVGVKNQKLRIPGNGLRLHCTVCWNPVLYHLTQIRILDLSFIS